MALAPDENVVVARDSGPRQIGGYLLGRQLGAGGMGVVYEAHRLDDDRQVAIKLIRDFHLAGPTALRRFMIEAEAAARLDHPNIVRIHEIDEHEGQPFLVVDFVEGESLNAKIHQQHNGHAGQATQQEIAALVAKICRAVHHAHSRGVLHRDIKPGNILIDSGGEPRLTDFGLAKIIECSANDPDLPTLTTSADAPGTPSYMSPEQVTRGNVNIASDVYSLGAVLYALLAGRPPFQATTPLEIFKQIAEQRPPRPRSTQGTVHPDLETICLKCLEKEPHHRYGSALSLAEDLESFAAGRPITARRPGAARRTRDWVQRNPLGAAVIAVLCLGLSVSLALLNVVNTQRREIELDRDQAFDESMQTVSQIWRDPATKSVTISARELAILAGRSPAAARNARHQLVLGVSANDGPSSMAQRYARLLCSFQEEMSRHLGEKVVFHLRLFKRFNPNDEALVRGEADFIVVTAVEFLRAQARATNITAIAHANTSREGVIFASARSGVRTAADLRGKSIAFPDPDLSITVSAKARIMTADLSAADFPFVTNIIDQGSEAAQTIVSASETIDRVLRGEVDAGVTFGGQFDRHKHRGLVLLDRFSATADVLATHAAVDPRFASALRSAIHSLGADQSWPESKFVAVETGTSGASDQSNSSLLSELRAEMQLVERFER